MKTQDVMTKSVITAPPDATVADLAELMVAHRISSLPIVVDGQHLVGIVTESDLIRRAETSTERKRRWWVELFLDPDTKSREFVKEHGLRAEDVMSRVVVTVGEDAPLADVATILDGHHIRRVPVIKDGRVVGLISKSDLVRALATVASPIRPATLDSIALHKAVYEALREHAWINATYMTFTVNDGIVTLMGFADSNDQRRALRVVVEEIRGVLEVKDNLKIRSWHVAA